MRLPLARASTVAAAEPAGPAPTTSTSQRGGSWAGSRFIGATILGVEQDWLVPDAGPLDHQQAALGVDAESYERYATKRWGQGWKKAAGGRKRALEDLTPFQDDGAGFVEKVKGELEVWA